MHNNESTFKPLVAKMADQLEMDRGIVQDSARKLNSIACKGIFEELLSNKNENENNLSPEAQMFGMQLKTLCKLYDCASQGDVEKFVDNIEISVEGDSSIGFMLQSKDGLVPDYYMRIGEDKGNRPEQLALCASELYSVAVDGVRIETMPRYAGVDLLSNVYNTKEIQQRVDLTTLILKELCVDSTTLEKPKSSDFACLLFSQNADVFITSFNSNNLVSEKDTLIYGDSIVTPLLVCLDTEGLECNLTPEQQIKKLTDLTENTAFIQNASTVTGLTEVQVSDTLTASRFVMDEMQNKKNSHRNLLKAVLQAAA
jgi:hypothetical protein